MKPIFSQDKANHYIVGQGLFAISFVLSYLPPWHLSFVVSTALATVVVAFFAVGKEVWDKKSGKGTPSYKDVVASMAGCLIPLCLLALLFNCS